jgi:hypothetical protein
VTVALTPVYYVLAILALLCGGAAGAWRFVSAQRKRGRDEGSREANLANALDENTKAAAANTAAIGQLGGKFDRFADQTQRRLDAGERRFEHELFRRGGQRDTTGTRLWAATRPVTRPRSAQRTGS